VTSTAWPMLYNSSVTWATKPCEAIERIISNTTLS
jgi:hypothetical protein